MQYLLLIYGNETAMLNAPKEASNQMHSAYLAYTEAMKKAGVLVGRVACATDNDRHIRRDG